jgi:hypothetical protein
MRGTVIKRGNGYSVVLDLDRGPDGKRIRKWHSGYRTRKLAERAQVPLVAKLQDGEYVDPSALTLAGLFERVFDYLESIGRDARTVERHRELARLHVVPYLGGVRLQQLALRVYVHPLEENRRRAAEHLDRVIDAAP